MVYLCATQLSKIFLLNKSLTKYFSQEYLVAKLVKLKFTEYLLSGDADSEPRMRETSCEVVDWSKPEAR